MRKLIACLFLALAAVAAWGADVQIPLAYFTQNAFAGKRIIVTPTNTPGISGAGIIVAEPKIYTNDADGLITISNMFGPCVYLVQAYGGLSMTPFRILVPDTNALLNATNLIVNVATNPSGTVSYPITASDARYLYKADDIGTNQTFIGLTLPIGATVGYVWTATNTDGAGAWQAAVAGSAAVDAGASPNATTLETNSGLITVTTSPSNDWSGTFTGNGTGLTNLASTPVNNTIGSGMNFLAIGTNIAAKNMGALLTNGVNIDWFGTSALATGDAMAFGNGAIADDHSTAYGLGATARSSSGAYGENATAINGSDVVGQGSEALTESTAFGIGSGSHVKSVAFGVNSRADNYSVAVGYEASVISGVETPGFTNIVIGHRALISGTRTNAIQIGAGSIARNNLLQIVGGNAANGADLDLASGTFSANTFVANSALICDGGNISSAGDGLGTWNVVTLNAAHATIDDGSGISGLNGSSVSSGTVAAARLGSGIANSHTLLHGDTTWGAVDLASADVTGSLPNGNLVNSSITVSGTANRVTVSGSPVSLGGTVTLSGPQDLATASVVQFGSAGLAGAVVSGEKLRVAGNASISGTITNAALTASKIVGSDSSTPPALTSITVGSGLTLSGGTLSASGGGGADTTAWHTNGNDGVGATGFLGTTDGNALIFKVKGDEIGRIDDSSDAWSGQASGGYAAIIWGSLNHATNAGLATTISGGNRNTTGGAVTAGTIAGGQQNTIRSNPTGAAISGGQQNDISGSQSAICGGENNTNTANDAIILGGKLNRAGGTYALAAGLRAKADHNGAMILTDSQNADFASVTTDQMALRFQNGITNNGPIGASGAATFGGVITGNGSGLTNVLLSQTVYAAGTAANLGTSSALLDFGTTDPSITIAAAGIYAIRSAVYVGADVDFGASADIAITFKLRKTSGTPADVSSASRTVTASSTFGFGTAFQMLVALPEVIFAANASDVIQLWGVRDAIDSGHLQAQSAEIVIVRIR